MVKHSPVSFGAEPAAGHGSLCGGPAGGFGSTPLWSPSGKAKHLDVKGDQPPDRKVVCGFLASSLTITPSADQLWF